MSFSDNVLSSSPPSMAAFGAGNGIHPTVKMFTKLVSKYIRFAVMDQKCNLAKNYKFRLFSPTVHLLDFYSRVSCVCAPIPTPALRVQLQKYCIPLINTQVDLWNIWHTYLSFKVSCESGFACWWICTFLGSGTPLPGFLAHFLSNFLPVSCSRWLKMLFVVVVEPSLSVMHIVDCLVVAHRQLKFIAASQ